MKMEGNDGVRKPKQPEKYGEKYSFNLGLYRIETLSEILKVCAKKYRKAIVKRDEESVHDYKAMVNVLYTETYIYMANETEFEFKEVKQTKDDILNMKLDNFSSTSGEEEVMQQLKDTRAIYLEIRRLLQNVGIDIPKEETIGNTEVFSKH